MYDTVINNGLVIDPASRIQSKLHLGISRGAVACLSPEPLGGRRVIDAAGLVVAPGFIDMHIHEDILDEASGTFAVKIFDCMLRMGVTTVIGGNCGIGPHNPAAYLAAADRLGLPVNIGLYAAHSEIRKPYAADNYRPAPGHSLPEMAADLDGQLAAGCVGLSFGLRYVPGTTAEELHALAAVAARHGKIVAAHARDDAAYIIAAAQELIALAAAHRAKVQISHIGSMAAFGQMETVLALVDAARASGLDIGLDCYPYNAFCTHIGSATYDPGFLERYGIGYDAIEITGGKYRGQRCSQAIFDEVRAAAPEVLAVAHVMRDREIDLALAHPCVAMASDGILVNGSGHPRAAGSFPRLVHQYVKTKKLLTLHEAIAKITVLPAQRLGLAKGSLAVGQDADIVIFDHDRLRDNADFARPLTPPSGIEWVLLRGEIAVNKGEIVNNLLGKAIRI
jgi:N-acyl-D-amino-acid deacylase